MVPAIGKIPAGRTERRVRAGSNSSSFLACRADGESPCLGGNLRRVAPTANGEKARRSLPCAESPLERAFMNCMQHSSEMTGRRMCKAHPFRNPRPPLRPHAVTFKFAGMFRFSIPHIFPAGGHERYRTAESMMALCRWPITDFGKRDIGFFLYPAGNRPTMPPRMWAVAARPLRRRINPSFLYAAWQSAHHRHQRGFLSLRTACREPPLPPRQRYDFPDSLTGTKPLFRCGGFSTKLS